MSPEFTALHQALVHDLRLISSITGEYELSDEALAWGEEWYERHWSSKHSHLAGDRFGGYISRKQTHVHKLAMVIAAAQRDETVVLPEDLVTADQLVSALEYNLPSVFNRISDNRDAKYSAAVFAVLRTEHAITKQKLWQKVYHLMSHDQFDMALGGILKAGFATCKQEGNDFMITVTQSGKSLHTRDKDRGTSLQLGHHESEAAPAAASRAGSSS